MTNAELLAKIKAEIEKRLKNTRDYMNGAGMKYKGPKYHASRGRESAYDAILSFLSTLKSEKPNDLEERWDELQTNFREINEAFEAGKREQREQMMKEAVEGEITKGNRGNNVVRAGVFNKDFEYGDKVRVIVLKKED